MAENMTSLKRALKKNTGLLIGLFVTGVVALVVGLILGGDTIIGAICCFVALVGILGGFLSIGEYKKIKNQHCPVCGSKYNYSNDISWEEISRETKEHTQTTSPTGVSESIISVVEVTCTCAHCGDEKTFNKKFTVAQILNNGQVKKHNLHNLIRKYFK